VAAWSKARAVLSHSNAGVASSNSAQGLDVSVILYRVSFGLMIGPIPYSVSTVNDI
jgi:hypothetical protein